MPATATIATMGPTMAPMRLKLLLLLPLPGAGDGPGGEPP